MSISGDDFVLLVKQIAQDQAGAERGPTLGYIASYDPATATVTAVVPSYCQPDPVTGVPTPITVGPIRLGSSWAGDGIGIQVAPAKAAATPQDPTQGEPVVILQFSHGTGIGVAAVMLFNAIFAPPDTALAPGDAYIKSGGGARLRFRGGDLVMQEGATPVAVEGSQITLDDALNAYGALLVTALAAATPKVTMVAPVVVGSRVSVDVGQGAQDVLAPAPGGS